jgi:hypothetical protein
MSKHALPRTRTSRGKGRLALLAVSALALASLSGAHATASTTDTSHGTWTAYPGQSTTYSAAVQQPINADGSSNFKANGKGVIPVKFALSQGTGAFAFESIFSDAATSNDYSYLNWHSATPLTFADITTLSAVYAFTDGDCAGGSLRWTVRLNDGGTNRNLDIHYQPGAGGVSQQTCAAGTSGANMVDSTDTIYVTQEFNGTHNFPSSYNNTYADAVAQLGSLPVVGATLIVDSGWGANGDQVVDLTSATVGVGGGTPYTETFTPQAGTPTAAVCPTQPAAIKISKTDGNATGDVNEPISIQPQDNNGLFRIVDCRYMYSLATSSLSGAGTYTVSATIGSSTFTVGSFDLK